MSNKLRIWIRSEQKQVVERSEEKIILQYIK